MGINHNLLILLFPFLPGCISINIATPCTQYTSSVQVGAFEVFHCQEIKEVKD